MKWLQRELCGTLTAEMSSSTKTLEPVVSCCAVLVLLALVWIVPIWPSQDGYSHLYTSVVLADLRFSPDSVFSSYFVDNLGLGTNQFFHGFVVVLAPYVSPWVAHKLFASLYVALMVFALRRYMRAVQPSSVESAPLFYTLVLSYPFFMGFYNFVIGIPLCLLGLALVIEHLADSRSRKWRVVAARRGTFGLTRMEGSAAWAGLGLFVVFMVTPYSLAQFHYVNTRAIPFLYFLTAPLIHLPKRAWSKIAVGLGVFLLIAQLLLLQGPVLQGAESIQSLRAFASSECVAQLQGQTFVPLRDDAQTFSDHVRWRASMWAPLAIDGRLVSPAAFGYRSAFPLVFHDPDWPIPWSTQIDGDTARLILRDETHRSAYASVFAFPNTETINRLEIVISGEVVERLTPLCVTPEVSVFDNQSETGSQNE